MTDPRTFKITDDGSMRGDDVSIWQRDLKRRFDHWHVDYPLVIDGRYGAVTRDATATVLYGLGISLETMERGVTPDLRVKVRNSRLNTTERARYDGRADWRKRLAVRHDRGGKTSPPLTTILSSSWGYHPPGHDGVDLICRERAPGLAICDGIVIRADSGGWWGKGAPSPAVAAKGDGIVIIRCTITAGPFKPGLNFAYGHAEDPAVRVGERVQAGERICRAGLANAWHFHFMVNNRDDNRGVGDRDPMPYIRYAQAHD